MVVLFDPHHIVRRMLPAPDGVSYRELSPRLIEDAERIKASKCGEFERMWTDTAS